MNGRFLAVLGATAALGLAYEGAALADNTATGTIGAVQVGPTTVTPTATVSGATVSAPVSIGGSGGNNATRSAGTVQAGGGNTARRSVGSAQVGGGNSANGSTGTAQVGRTTAAASASAQSGGTAAHAAFSSRTSGGNSADGSTGVVQVGGLDGTSTAGTSGGPAGDRSTSVPLAVGDGGANTAEGSTGVVQVGGSSAGTSGPSTPQGSDAGGSIGALLTSLAFPTAGAPAPDSSSGEVAGVSPASATAAERSRVKAQPAGERARVATQGAPAPRSLAQTLSQAVRRGVLPFTGLSLLLWAALALGVGVLGLGVRAKTVS